jgi:hypothetical protein
VVAVDDVVSVVDHNKAPEAVVDKGRCSVILLTTVTTGTDGGSLRTAVTPLHYFELTSVYRLCCNYITMLYLLY